MSKIDMWGYTYVLKEPVYRWARPGFILTAVIFALVAVPVYIIDGWDAGHAVSVPLAIADVALVATGWYLYATGKLKS